jgi:hypothetical protein
MSSRLTHAVSRIVIGYVHPTSLEPKRLMVGWYASQAQTRPSTTRAYNILDSAPHALNFTPLHRSWRRHRSSRGNKQAALPRGTRKNLRPSESKREASLNPTPEHTGNTQFLAYGTRRQRRHPLPTTQFSPAMNDSDDSLPETISSAPFQEKGKPHSSSTLSPPTRFLK